MQLIDTLTADGNSAVWYVSTPHKGTVHLTGTFGSGTAKVQISRDGTTYYDFSAQNSAGTVADVAYTEDEIKAFDPFASGYYRIVLSGSTNPSIKIFVTGSHIFKQ